MLAARAVAASRGVEQHGPAFGRTDVGGGIQRPAPASTSQRGLARCHRAVRRADDFYPTGQPEAVRGLLARDGDAIRACGSVWEPACGDGALVREIRSAGIPCCASDLIERGCPDSWVADYYSCLRSRAQAIITNPPYCEINARDGHGRWLRHTLSIPGWNYLALLLSWDWPAARANGLGALLDSQPFSYCYLMRWKLDFTGEGSRPSAMLGSCGSGAETKCL